MFQQISVIVTHYITTHVRYLSANIIQSFGKLSSIGIWRTIYKLNDKRHGIITCFYKQGLNDNQASSNDQSFQSTQMFLTQTTKHYHLCLYI